MTDQDAPAAVPQQSSHQSRVSEMFHRAPSNRLQELHAQGPAKISQQHEGINGKIALFITNKVGTMWCAYVFTVIGVTGLVGALTNDVTLTLIFGAISSYVLQLVLLPIIIVGQNIQGKAADKRSEDTYKDAEAILHECLQLQEHLQAQDKILDDVLTHLHERFPQALRPATPAT